MLLRVLRLVGCLMVVCAAVASARADEEARLLRRRVFELNPKMSAIAAPGVPALDQSVPDADRVAEGLLAIEPGRAYRWIVLPGQELDFAARGRADGIDRTVLTVWDWENRPVAQTGFTVPFEGRVRCSISGRGTWVVTLDGLRGDECVMRLVRSFSACPSNESRRALWKNSEFWVGQCSFPGWHGLDTDGRAAHPPGLTVEESRELEAELIARMGVQVARINLVVNRRDAEGMDLDFALADKCVKAYVSRGLSLDVQLFMPYGEGLGPVLDKYAKVTGGAIYPLKEKAYRHYVRETVRRYGKHARFFQIGNEPGNPKQYSGTAEEYVDQVKQAVDEIRKICPRIPITNGGYCFDNDETKYVIRGVRGLTDFVSHHWHSDLPGLKQFRASIEQIHRDAGYPAARYANTEMGMYMPTVAQERTNAVCEMQKLLYSWAHGYVGVLLYASRESWWPRQHDREYGFVDYFYCPRFVYGAASAFLDRYAGFRFERVLKEDENLHVYEFSSGSRRMIAAFAVRQPVEIKLKSDAKSAALIDPMGNETAISDSKSITISAGEYPQSVLFEGASNVTLSE